MPEAASGFWQFAEQLLASREVRVERPRGSAHPSFPDTIYPLDYGYLENTSSTDRECIDVWLGVGDQRRLSAVICTVDMLKSDMEIKLALGCGPEDLETIVNFYERSRMRCLVVRYGGDLP